MIKNELKDISDLKDFIIKSIEPRLITSTKAYTKNVWSLGYITSSISECNNSNIKRLLGTKALTLCEMRDVITQSDKRRNMNRVYIKNRKTRKAFGKNVVKFMKSFMVDKRIAEALNGSYEKTEKLESSKINDYWIVKELKTNDSFLFKIMRIGLAPVENYHQLDYHVLT